MLGLFDKLPWKAQNFAQDVKAHLSADSYGVKGPIFRQVDGSLAFFSPH